MAIYNSYNEAKVEKEIYKPTHIVEELCTCMCLLNNNFLDSILDRGKIARYTENTNVFINDLKNLLFKKNRLYFGKFINNKCVEDTEVGKLTKLFDNVTFKIEDDFTILTDSRLSARNIIDKFPDNKLTEEMIKCIYWLGPNKTEEFNEDIVLELSDGRQFSFFLNKNVTLYKSASFAKLCDDLIGNHYEALYGPIYIQNWNLLTKKWIELIYKNATKNMQRHIEKFINPPTIEHVTFFKFLELEHRDPRYKNLGEFISELDDNYLYLKDLLADIWKNRDVCIINPDVVYEEWMKDKIHILNSRILEHIITEGLLKTSPHDVIKLKSGFKLAKGNIKMKLIKAIVSKLGCKERNIFYMGNGGNVFTLVPTLKFFREGFESLQISFDYHVHLTVKGEERKNDFEIRIVIKMDNTPLMHCDLGVSFGRSGELTSSALRVRFKFGFESDFNERIFDKMKKQD